MKLITETIVASPFVSEENGAKSYFIEGPFLQAEIKNRNGRVYPLELLVREVNRYKKDFIAEKRALGELGHPDSPTINLDRVSHMIVEINQAGNDFMGRAKILDTPNGRIVKALIDDGVQLGVSSRGVGSLNTTSQGDVVGDDFYLATAADIVADPSAPNAFVRGIMEGKEWVWENGRLTEAQIQQYRRELEAAPKKKAEPRRIEEAALFERFIRSINVTVK
jgi:hypothetical protein